jgi:hypothetical protein
MTRLYRPHIPVVVRCRVALRQLGELWQTGILLENRNNLGKLLDESLVELAALIGCKRNDLQLDHDPPLAVRKISYRNNGHLIYEPDANDPEYLIYREKRAHQIKTNVRGDGAQYPDRVLIKRERRRREPPRAKLKRKWPSRPLRSRPRL